MLIWRGYGIIVFPILACGIGLARHLAHDQKLPWLGLLVVLGASSLIALIGFYFAWLDGPAAHFEEPEEYSAAPPPPPPPPSKNSRRGRRSSRATLPWERRTRQRRADSPEGPRVTGPPVVHDFFFIPVLVWSPITLLIGLFAVFTKAGA